MKIYNFPAPYFIKKFEKHESFKHKVLDLISESQHGVVGNPESGAFNVSDWNVDPNIERKYFTLIFPHIREHMQEIFDTLKLKEFYFQNVWFQQYYVNHFHSFHVHETSSWNNVYYLELDKDCPGTSFLNVLDDTIHNPLVEEGDILTFPSFIKHSSMPNSSNSRKTVVAFNIA